MHQYLKNMAIDTLKLKSPSFDASLARKIEAQCILRSGKDLATGEILYEITTGNLLGSWDSRISLKVMREEYESRGRGKIELVPCEPYLLLEGSVHKIFFGHNVYGGPTDFLRVARDFVCLTEDLLGVDLPLADWWEVRRVDWAEMFRLSYVGIQEFFEGMSTCNFPRRKGQKYGMHSIYFPGTHCTLKLYHKGPDFQAHDARRLNVFFKDYRYQKFPQDEMIAANTKWAKRKVEALQRLANNRLRVEAEIHADKLDYDFGHKPLVSEVTEDYLRSVYDKEMLKLMREGKSDMETVRESRAVKNRLVNIYGEGEGSNLFGFFMQLAGFGEEVVRQDYLFGRRPTFYRKRLKLEKAGVSWMGSNVHVIANEGALPRDFVPYRTDSRLCVLPARTKPAFIVERDYFKKAA